MNKKIKLTKSEKIMLKLLQYYGPVGVENCTCGLVACWIDYKGLRSYCHAVTAKHAFRIMLKRIITARKELKKILNRK